MANSKIGSAKFAKKRNKKDDGVQELKLVEKLLIHLMDVYEDGTEIDCDDLSQFGYLLQHPAQDLWNILERYGVVEPGSNVFLLSEQEIYNFLKMQQNKICDALKSNCGVANYSNFDIGELVDLTAEIKFEEEEDNDFFFVEHNGTLETSPTMFQSNSSNVCFICNQRFLNTKSFEKHIQCVHRENFVNFVLRERREKLLSRPFLKVELVKRKIICYDNGDDDESTYIRSLKVKHRLTNDITIEEIKHFYCNKFDSVVIPSRIRVLPDETADIEAVIDFENSATAWHSIFIYFRDESTARFYIEHYHVKDSRRFKQKENHIRPRHVSELAPPEDLVTVFNNGFLDTGLSYAEKALCNQITTLYQQSPSARLNTYNYVQVLSYCVELNDCGEEFAMKAYDLMKQQLIPQKNTNSKYNIKIDSNTNLPRDVSENDKIVLRCSEEDKCYKYEGIIKCIQVNILTIEIENPEHFHVPKVCPHNCQKRGPDHIELVKCKVEEKCLFDIRFKQLRVPVKLEKTALQIVQKQKLTEFLFPTKKSETLAKIQSFEWLNKNVESNREQKQAVKYIVNGTAYPAPYIIFGPPGTGKTSTIVEAICQLCKVDPKYRILVTAQSNAACNELSDRLMKYLKKEEMYRMFSKSNTASVRKAGNDQLLRVSNMASRKHIYPTWEELYKYRVVICTLSTAGNLQLAGIDPLHFTHVFIDECASATEPSSLIAIAGIITTDRCINGRIVLAGDIHQLGPVVRFKMADNLGYGHTLMERLMDLPVYKKDPVTGSYNKRMITKLLLNFRSHEKILELSNKMFYEGELVAKGDPKSTEWAENWCHLPNKQFSVIFHPGYAPHGREKSSLYNQNEVDIIAKYVKLILTFGINGKEVCQQDIGIISPYKRQCQRLSRKCGDNNWKDIEVGTVESFQGREKDVIFISTVRSNTNCVGFLNNPKRLNVSLTRAKALMIIVGNPDTLRNDQHWHDLLKYCHDNGGCVTPIDVGPRPESTVDDTNSMHDVHADFRKMFGQIKEKLAVSDFK